MEDQVSVVGGGLAGCECALQLARRGIRVRLFEQRPAHESPAHHTGSFAELVCSNSLKSTKPDTAAGLLKNELDMMGSVLLGCARRTSVPAGGALAVDREAFSAEVTRLIESELLIEVARERVREIPVGQSVIAAGPLCSDELFEAIANAVGGTRMSFYDAAAPIVDADSLDRSVVFEQSRYEQGGGGDYLNCPMSREEYDAFMDALLSADRVIARDFEQRDLFCACQPLEEVARTGHDSLRYGALKPVGLTDPRTGRRPWAAVQLRAENPARTAFNLVGFQTNLTWPEQRRVFRMIPGLESAEFLRYGVMHRNSFVDAPHALDRTFKIPGTRARLAGQITGTEGYVEAIASGLLAALNTYAEVRGLPAVQLPPTGALGSLVAYATDPATTGYQPMHVNFGIVPPLQDPPRNKAEKRAALVARAAEDLTRYLEQRPDLFPAAAGDR
ncbi:methylenetetrahydrofolate--tRNA-(uracil(54)-C(5))-methyltransferase (FADH(2)-oxidizing) TrmFO [Thermophilibacter provencensis]|uniref:Methylenetetrahydrofolate--tRNA-(uracil-5-)-methyltransferase TrmFO n=1 Tax=Thermophilibacter provencensis TaxID=1852386 RepID=A0ABT7V2X9_9ACTN|nr:methylenetetrahydrofolate--tRNA-(uracil(54)-C(5))-methyltransferase (FADH(2)-oxidizing) TrmFO [Thermophilibacter provencensis]MDM8270952.1 methylenetetrahydrofolate--tRNA-(uracil(54)-C(5))-methyltransferase (FADH(2)-oxidizing) TrmFO [Thermophilibacter provencensis]